MKASSGSPGMKENGPRLKRTIDAGMRPLEVSRWHCMQISMRSFGLRRAGLTMLARTSAGFAAAIPDGAHMVASGAVTALAVDAFREVAREDGVAAGRFVAGGICGIPLWQNMHL